MSNVTVIKKYTNRKLYDTKESKYITLKDLVTSVASGQEVQVIDNTTKTDITGPTLLSAIVETEQDLAGQTTLLCDIVKAGGLSKYLGSLPTVSK
jgi:polyhydroxyalkanoate synthesis repressor PhaR